MTSTPESPFEEVAFTIKGQVPSHRLLEVLNILGVPMPRHMTEVGTDSEKLRLLSEALTHMFVGESPTVGLTIGEGLPNLNPRYHTVYRIDTGNVPVVTFRHAHAFARTYWSDREPRIAHGLATRAMGGAARYLTLLPDHQRQRYEIDHGSVQGFHAGTFGELIEQMMVAEGGRRHTPQLGEEFRDFLVRFDEVLHTPEEASE